MTAPLRSVRRFEGRVALVTGGGSGIGRATAEAFAAEGAAVVVAGRTASSLEDTVRLIEKNGGRATAAVTDVTSSQDVAAAVAMATGTYGRLDVAFNNAGIVDGLGYTADIDEAAWNRVLATNLTGIWLSMKHEIGHMAANGGGAIVNMSSLIGPHITIPAMAGYGAARAAVSSLTRTAAKEYIGAGVRINAISPGPVDTPQSLLPGESEAARAERIGAALPAGRVASREEIATTVLWLASSESAFAVGLDLLVDGGGAA